MALRDTPWFASSGGLARVAALLYIDIWVLEGAARKWLPGADQIFYFARDGFAVLVLCALLVLPNSGPKRRNGWFWIATVTVGILASLQVIGGVVSLPVALVGLRSYVAPLILLALCLARPGAVTAADVGKRVLVYAPLQIVLAVIQVLSPPASAINAQPSGDITQFVSDGVPRAAGTFSSPAGFVAYVTIAFAIALAFVVTSKRHRVVLIGIFVGLSVAAIISGSRGAVLNVAIVAAGYVLYAFVRGQARIVGATIGLGLAMALVVLAVAAALPQVVDAFLSRFEDASRAEDSGARILRQAFGYFSAPIDAMGDGVGAHSQAGIALGSSERWIEIETIRWVAELGLLGLIASSMTSVLVLWIMVRALVRLRQASLLHVLVVAVAVPLFLIGHVTQTPSSQGFAGIVLALLVLTWNDTDSPTQIASARMRRRTAGVKS